MPLSKLKIAYKHKYNHQPMSLNQLLDYCQQKYVLGEIDIKLYRTYFYYLHQSGAISAYACNDY